VWRKFHVLNRVPAFIVCALSAAILASACAIVTHERTGLFRDFFWPHQFDRLVAFGAIFLAILIVLLAYYHLGRLGVVVMLLGAFAAYYGMVFCAIYVFASGVLVGVVGYSTVLALSSALLYFLHAVATTSRKIEDAQRGLGLRRNSRAS
jgi:TRAP-type C4-dicarboxylate transport system permease small subunit